MTLPIVSTATLPTENPANHSVPLKRAPLAVRITNILLVTIPLIGLGTAIGLLWGWGFTWVDLGLLVGMYALTVLGVTTGFHRLFTHGSFETGKTIKFILGVLGSMAVEGSLLRWVALHRRHHQHSDQVDDPHSPHHQGTGILGMLKGAWHAHIGWFFTPEPYNLASYVKDLRSQRMLRTVSNLFPLWVVIGMAIPALLGGLLTMSWMGALLGLLWGSLVRILLVHHVTWSVNSICHLWGGQPYESRDESRNNIVVGFLAFGEGWHNNHHAFPTSARHGLEWWQLDLSYWLIRGLAIFGLAWEVKMPTKKALKAASRRARAAAISGPASRSLAGTNQASPPPDTSAPQPC